MGALDSIIKLKQLEAVREQQDIQAIGDSVTNFLNIKKREEESVLDERLREAQIRNIESQIETREKDDPLEDLLKRGKAVDAAFSIGRQDLVDQIRNKSAKPIDAVNKSLSPVAQIPESTATSLDNFIKEPEPVKEPQVGDFIAESLDRFGNPTGFKRVKETGAQEKRNVEINELEGQVKGLIESFAGAREEVSDIKNIGKRGVKGRVAGLEAVVRGKFGNSPKANVFQDKLKAFATTVAKAAGEVRPTDMDIKRFIGTLPTLTKNDEENTEIIEALINDVKVRGAKAVWEEKAKQEVSSKLRSFGTVEEAEAANLPKGTVISIKGKKAVIE